MKHYRLFFIEVLCGIALCVSPALAAEVTIGLHPRALLSSLMYTLGDVAQIQAEQNLLDQLRRTKLGVAPRMGYSTTVSRADIQKIIEQQNPGINNKIQWSGADKISIRSVGKQIESEMLIDTAARALSETLSKQYEAFEVTPTIRLDNISLPSGEVSITPRVRNNQSPSKRLCVWLDITVDGEHYRSIPIWFGTHLYQPALVAKAAVPAGSLIKTEYFTKQIIDIAGASSLPLSSAASLNKYRLKHSIAAGAPLLSSDIEAQPSIQRNQAVAVKVVMGAITVETTGVAAADAKLGDIVKVKNDANNEVFMGKVIADGAVVVSGR